MPDASRPLRALQRLVEAFTRRVDYLALYPARVVSQEASGLLHIVPDDSRLPPCQGVPYRTLPGVALTVPAGARVLLGYESGDPSRPIALLWELGDVTRLAVNGSTTRAAREGDDVSASTTLATWMTAVTTKLNSGLGVVPTPPSTIGTIAEGSDVVRIP